MLRGILFVGVNDFVAKIDFKALFLTVERKLAFFCGINGKKKWLKRDKIDMIFLSF